MGAGALYVVEFMQGFRPFFLFMEFKKMALDIEGNEILEAATDTAQDLANKLASVNAAVIDVQNAGMLGKAEKAEAVLVVIVEYLTMQQHRIIALEASLNNLKKFGFQNA